MKDLDIQYLLEYHELDYLDVQIGIINNPYTLWVE